MEYDDAGGGISSLRWLGVDGGLSEGLGVHERWEGSKKEECEVGQEEM